jgi:hypothetical protein
VCWRTRVSPVRSRARDRLRAGFLSALVRFHALERFAGALVRLLGAGDCRDGSAVEGSVAFLRGGWGPFGDDRIRVGWMVEWCLLLVEDVSAQVLGSLVVVELGLVCVAAVLSETQFGLAAIDRGGRSTVIVIGAGAVGVERYLCFVEALLVAVGADLFAFGDALVEVDQCLFLVEFALLAGS